MFLLRIIRITTVVILYSWLYQDTESLVDNAFSHIAKVNLRYGKYQDQGRYYQIDMKLNKNHHTKKRVARAATNEKERLWPNATIPYVIADSIVSAKRHMKLLLGAMAEWQKKTCLKFKKRTVEKDFVEFYYGEGCNSDVGVVGTGRQTTSLGEGCEDHGIMVHEIGHLIGLYHEQNRPDRDRYVTIHLENVFPRYHYAFEKKDREETDSRGVPYDFYSVMHYGSKDFSKNKKPTIVSKVEGITEFGNTKISNLDAKVVNLMYKCPELIKFPRDFYWRNYGIGRRDKDCIQVNEPEDPYSWSNNYLCRRPGKLHIGLEWSNKGPIEGMSCIKAEAPSMEERFGWNNNYFCWPMESVYKFTWLTKVPDRSNKRNCLKIYEPRDRYWSKRHYYLCGKQDESPVDGKWSEWSKWTQCSRKCGGGYRRRVRTCNNPPPSYRGRYCIGASSMTGRCGMKSCEEWPTFPDDFVYKVFALPPLDLSCIRTYERYEYHKWANHLFCVRDDKKDPQFVWSDGGPKPGMKCVRIYNPIETRLRPNTWDNNYLCIPISTPYNFKFSRKGPIKGMACLRWFPKENRGWDNSYLCSDTPKSTGSEVIKEKQSVHGGWSSWGPWTECSKSCSGGDQKRFRSCTNPRPQNNGNRCSGSEKEQRACNLQECSVDGQWSSWDYWSRCSKSCGTGEQQRRRTCNNPPPKNGGKQCQGLDILRKRCNEHPCPVDGGWSPWTWWARCSKTCGRGKQLRSRSCTSPKPKDGGRPCLGKHAEIRVCNSGRCPIDGAWSPWFRWSACSKTCSGGIQVRRRTCTRPAPQFGGRRCLGEQKQEKRCNTSPCPIDGNWAKWTPWRACSKSCGGGIQSRMRTCSNPIPRYGGKRCLGKAYEEQGCQTQPCPLPPVDGRWSQWSRWKQCSKTCAGGVQQRIRTCTNPAPANGGRKCSGIRYQERRCNTGACPELPVDGKWSLWSQWKVCSKTCGPGIRQRTRSCTNPTPKHGGKHCAGVGYQTTRCNLRPCRIDGRWSLWTSWKPCSKTCGLGITQRTRSCNNPRPAYGGRRCLGRSFQARRCNIKPCKVRIDGRWSLWSKWKACSKLCGGGIQQRTRSCTNPRPANGGNNCRGSQFETRRCNTQYCRIDGRWTTWSSWQACNRRCGGGYQQRIRSCTNPRPANGGRNCIGRTIERRRCNTRPCAIDGSWSSWSRWTVCNKLCDGGISRRMRSCTNPRPSNSGKNCIGRTFQTKRCNTAPCEVDGQWSAWKSWGYCSASCGGGKQRRERTCTNPPPNSRGRLCKGMPYEDRKCNTHPCRKLGWSNWSEWSACSSSCGGGTQERRRTCNGRCGGRSRQTQRCNTFKCRIVCGGIVTGRRGKIMSPGYPRYYPDNIECTWIIRVPDNLLVRLQFTFFYMENGESCRNDNVEIRDGSQSSRVLGKYCGAAKPDIMWSTGTHMWVRFRSNNRYNYRGFEAIWRAVDSKPDGATSAGNFNNVVNGMYDSGISGDTCGGLIKSNHGRITSPGFPNNYRPNLNCEWLVVASVGRVIQFYFEYIDIDDTGYCGRDFVSLRDGNFRKSPSLGRYCGRRKERGKKTTSSNYFRVRFRTDGTHERRGFSLRWTSFYKYRASNPARRELIPRKTRDKTDAGEVVYQFSNYKCPYGWVSYTINDKLYCYTLRKHYHSWLKASVKCRQFGAELLTITDSFEQEFVQYKVQKDNYVWIGLNDFRQEGNWTWENRTPLRYTNWALGEPNNGQRYWNEHCALMKPNGKWNDFPCDFQFSYICKMLKR